MKVSLFSGVLLLSMGLSSCEDTTPSAEQEMPNYLIAKKKLEEGPKTDKPKFDISFEDITLSASINGDRSVTILNYPSEWRSKMALMRFDGTTTKYKPFSKDHCDIIRGAAKTGFGNLVVRGGYHSLIVFDLPHFLSNQFKNRLITTARTIGYEFSHLILENEIDIINPRAHLTLKENAISRIIGNIDNLEKQLSLRRVKNSSAFVQNNLIITAADLICDLVSGDAILTIKYPISGGDGSIKIIYDPLNVNI